MAKKIMLDAGHGLNTSGKQTCNGSNGIIKEWTLNDAVCRNVAYMLADYDVEIIRADDITGQRDIPVSERTSAINKANPDISISIHHNANTGTWGNWTGVEVYSHLKKPNRDAYLAEKFVNEIAKNTGLKNRGAKYDDFHMIRETNSAIPSVLCEGGFMDGTTDYPVITSDNGQKAYAQAVANICITYLGLQKKTSELSDNTPSDWAREPWAWAKLCGITDGINPKSPATREMVVTMLYRLLQKEDE